MAGFTELIGIIDAEYDVICDMDEPALITYLVESFDADRDVARRALENFGLIGEE